MYVLFFIWVCHLPILQENVFYLTLTLTVMFRDYVRLDLLWYENVLKAVRAVKLYNLAIRQIASEFNMNYPTLSHYCKKIPEED